MNLDIIKVPQKKINPQQDPWDCDPQEDRYMIIEKETKKIIDNAGGHGFKSFASAKKAMWYRFEGGKQKTDSLKFEATKFWKDNPLIKSFVDDFYMYGFKEMARGELSENDLISNVKDKFNITLNKKYLKYA